MYLFPTFYKKNPHVIFLSYDVHKHNQTNGAQNITPAILYRRQTDRRTQTIAMRIGTCCYDATIKRQHNAESVLADDWSSLYNVVTDH